MIQEKIGQGDLLYHAVHGLCKVDNVSKQLHNGKQVLSYALVPKVMDRMKVRYVMAAPDLEESGFHFLISIKEANRILSYLKAGKVAAVPPGVKAPEECTFAEENQTWVLARAILTSSQDNPAIKHQRKRELLERAAKGLVGEFAHVFELTLKDTANMIRKCLGQTSKINPLVLTALVRASED